MDQRDSLQTGILPRGERAQAARMVVAASVGGDASGQRDVGVVGGEVPERQNFRVVVWESVRDGTDRVVDGSEW